MNARDRAELARLHELAVELEDAAANMREDAKTGDVIDRDGDAYVDADAVGEFATTTEALCKDVRAILWKLLDGKLYTEGDK